jgi:hypothetical protein
MLLNKPSEFTGRELGMLQLSKSHPAAASHLSIPRSHNMMPAHLHHNERTLTSQTSNRIFRAVRPFRPCVEDTSVYIHDEASGGLRARRHFRKKDIQEDGKALSGSVDPCTRMLTLVGRSHWYLAA